MVEDEDETVNPDDLSMCSEDEYDMVIQDDHPVRGEEDIIAGRVTAWSYWVEENVPVLKGQYDVTDNQFTWVGIVGVSWRSHVVGLGFREFDRWLHERVSVLDADSALSR